LRIAKNIFFAIILLSLLLPAAQKEYDLVELKPLHGYFLEQDTFVPPTKQTFISGDFQEKYSNYYEHSLGFRPFLVRLRNQYMYSVYHKSMVYAFIGKEGQLFSQDYWETYRGMDFIGEDSIHYKFDKLIAFRDSLKQDNKHLLCVLAPNKVRLLAQYLPDNYNTNEGEQNNYKSWIQLFKENDIAFIDVNDWYSDIMDTASYELFPNTGTHWNSYGMHLVLDSILRRFQQMDTSEVIREMEWKGWQLKDSAMTSDLDLANDMNLIFPLQLRPMAFPIYPENKTEKGVLPKTFILGDSFFWGFYGLNIFQETLHHYSRFWYYNNTQMDMAQGSNTPVKELNAHEVIKDKKYVLLMATEANLDLFPFGICEKYLNEKSPDKAN